MRKDLLTKSVKVTNAQLRHYNSLLRKNLRLVISCSADNEKAQQRIDTMEELVFNAPTLKSMFDTLITQGMRIFEIDVVAVSLERPFREHYPEAYQGDEKSVFLSSDRMLFMDPDEMAAHFSDPLEPVIRGDLLGGTKPFFPNGSGTRIRSEALAPLYNGRKIIGVAAFGSEKPKRFLEGYGTRFLKRMARTLTLKAEMFRVAGPEWNGEKDVL